MQFAVRFYDPICCAVPMPRRLTRTVVTALTALSLFAQSIVAGPMLCRDCCSSGGVADQVCCQSDASSTSCPHCVVNSRVSQPCCQGTVNQHGKPTDCHCFADSEPMPFMPLSSSQQAQECLVWLSCCNQTLSQPRPEIFKVKPAFGKSPIAHSAPPSVQTLHCVWRI